MGFFQKKTDLMSLKDNLDIWLCSLRVAAACESKKHISDLPEDADFKQIMNNPRDRFTSYAGKYFFGYLIEFVYTYGFALGCHDSKERQNLVLKIVKGFTPTDKEVEFMKLCLLEYSQLSRLDSERADIKVFKDGIYAGSHDANLIIQNGFPDKHGITPQCLDNSQWQSVHFPLLREYLRTGITEKASFYRSV